MKYQEDIRNDGKIPYDSRPIIRQPANTSRRRSERTSSSGNGLTLIVCVLVVLNLVLSGLVFTLIKKNANVQNNTTINIETSGTLDVSAATSKCRSSVVRIHAGLPTGYASSTTVDYAMFSKLKSKGSGVVFEDEKENGICYIVTCYHVVCGYDSQIYVILNDSFTPVKASLVSFSSKYDIAVIKIDNDLYKTSSAAPAEIADSSLVIDGDACIAYGNPQGTGFSVTNGVVSKAVDLVTVNNVVNRVMRTSAAINAGNSGGGLFDATGKLIGIVNAKTGDVPSSNSYIDNIAYAIPSDVAISLAKNILRNSLPKRADLGITLGVANVNETYDIVNGRQIMKQTIFVTEAKEGSAFQVNDQLVNFIYNGNIVNVRNLYSIDDHIFNFDVGDVITFQVLRNNVLTTLEITINAMVSADEKNWYN